MSEILVNTIKKADGTGGLTVPAESGTVLTSASDLTGVTGVPPTGAQAISIKMTGDSSSLTNNSLTKIPFAGTNYDPDTLWDTTNYNFTVPSGEGGLYLIGGSVVIFNSSSKIEQVITYIYIQGSSPSRYRLNKPNTGAPFQHMTGSMQYLANLSAGDVVDYRVYTSSSDGTSGSVVSANSTAFIVRVA